MRKRAILIAHGIVGWAVCGATIGVGRQLVSMDLTLLFHAVVTPLVFGLLTWLYYKQFPKSSAFATSITMLAVVIGLDVFVVAPFVERSFAMFTSVLGTWVPFASIFVASYLVGKAVCQ